VALIQSKLQRALASAWRQPTDSCAVAAGRVAAAYASYASAATSCAGGTPLPASILAAQQKLRVALIAAYASSGFNETVMIQRFATACSMFWSAPPIAFVGAATPGIVTAALAPPLYAALQGAISNLTALCRQIPGPSADYAAQLWSSALDSWTRTVLVVHSPPSACAGPIF
jgi:hypothetical protein